MRLLTLALVLLVLGDVAAAAGSYGGSRRSMALRPQTERQIVAEPAAAQSTGSELASLLANRSYLPPGSVTGAGGALPAGLLKDLISGAPGALGTTIAVEAVRGVSAAALAKTVARGIPLLGTGIIVAELLEDIRCRQLGSAAGPECDAGTDPVPSPAYCASNNGSTCTTWAATVATYQQVWSQHVSYLQSTAAPPGAGYSNSWSSCTTSGQTGCGGAVSSAAASVVVRTTTGPGGPYYSTYSVGIRTTTMNLCPAGQGIPAGQPTDPDGKCKTGTYAPANVVDVEAKVSNHGLTGRSLPSLIEEIDKTVPSGGTDTAAIDTMDPDPISLSGPSAAAPPHRETTVHPDGSTTVKDTSYPITYNNNSYSWTTITNTRTYPPGSTIPPLNTPDPSNPGTTTTGGTTEVITCGLPNTPKCKIDEGGTPPPSDPFGGNDPSSWFSSLPIENPEVADTSWTWSFAMPSSCSAVTIGPFITKFVTVDLCQWQPMIHDIMSLVWLATTVWVCIGMLGVALRG